MKRIILIALLCMALFALPALAEDCDHSIAWCDGKCIDCGTAGVNVDEIWHKYEKYEYYDETGHWAICTLCGQKDTDLWEHNVLCNGTCSECGVTGLPANAENHDYKPVYYDESSHRDTCTLCGAESEDLNGHSVSCMASDTSICEGCGYAASNMWINHVDEMIDANDETHHWTFFPTCGMTGTKEEHCVFCINPGVCDSCGRSGLDLPVNHVGRRMTGSNGTEHWEYCSSCDAEYADTRAAHTVLCTNPGVCTECGATDCTNEETHVGSSDGTWYTDSTTHWQLCACGEKINKSNHDNCGGNCSTCGMAVTHAYDYDAPEYDEANHWFTCLNGCGEKLVFGHYNSCTDTEHCAVCGADYVGDWSHNPDWNNMQHDDTYCWTTCIECGMPCEKEEHSQVCTDPGVCGRCGVEVSDDVFMYHFLTEETQVTGDGTHHWWPCEECGEQIDKNEHSNSCTNPGICTICGLACDETLEVSHNYDWETFLHDEDYCWVECVGCGAVTSKYNHSGDGEWLYDESHHWAYCIRCGEIDGKYEHRVYCTTPGECTACGYEMGDDVEVGHYRYADTPYEYDETYHWFTCVLCREPAFKAQHKFTESERDESKVIYTCGCGATKEEELHTECTFVESSRVDASCGVKGEIVCTCECGETKTEEIPALEHSYITTETPATCEANGKKVTTCILCGDETAEVLPATGHDYDISSLRQPTCTAKGIKEVTCEHCGDETVSYIDALGHAYTETVTEATCEADGAITKTCAVCGEEQTEVIPAAGHAFGLYATKGDGTHAASCAVCGAERVRDCEYKDVTTNGITLTACTVCGHTYYGHLPVVTTEAEGAAETEAAADTLFTPARVTGSVAKSAATQEEISAQLVIYDQAGTLPENSAILAMYTLCLESDGYAVQPKEALTIELPLSEAQTAEDFAGCKLYCIDSTGVPVEIEYTIEEGVIIFETTMVGIFVFLPADAVTEG